VTLRVVEGSSIEGEVHGPAGTPLGAAEVRASLRVVPVGWSRTAVTDAQGRFRLTGLPHGASLLLRAQVADEGLLPKFAEGVRAGTSGVVLRLERAHRISGTALDAAGRPLTFGMVEAEPLPRASPRRPWQHGWVHDGRFEIRGLDGGTYRVRTKHEPTDADAPSAAVLVTPPARDLTLRRRPGAVLRGRVVEGGAGAGVRWSSPGLETSTSAGADGSFELRGLLDEPGTLHVSTVGPPYALLRDVRPSTAPLEIRLANGARVAGRLEIPVGTAATYVNVVLRGDGVAMGALVTPERRFVAVGVPPGTYEVRLTVDGDESLHAPLVEAGAEDVVIRWEPGP
jgi:hypothetical protein